jgi:hypothetical protein
MRKGKFPFILQKLRTEQENVFKEIWVEIPPGKVKYQTHGFGKRKKLKIK